MARVMEPGSQCEGKSKFTIYAHAERRARRLSERSGERIAPYRCPHCSFWHLGTGSHDNIHNPVTVLYRMRKRQLREAA